MALERREQIQKALQEMQRTPGMGPLKRLFLTELEYEPENIPLFRDGWPELAQEALHEDPQIIFSAGNTDDRFYVIYCRLADEQNRLLLTKERAVITYLLQQYPYAMFIFSSRNQDHWHFVNVKYDKDDRARRLFRRISVSRHERLRTAVDRISELSIPAMQRDLFGLSAFQVQQAHDKAFDVEKVTKDFFVAYKRIFDELQNDLHQQTGDLQWAHDYALQFLNRVMFLYFVQRKLWLRTEQSPKGDPDFVNTFWQTYRQEGKAADTFYSHWLSVLFFNAFNQGEKDEDDPAWSHLPPSMRKSMADAPYLNGGLFRENDLDRRTGFVITDARFSRIFDFLERYNFTISEDTPLDQEVAVDPEMIGKVYESLVNVSEDGTADERSEAGIFYTPRTEIDLMCRLSLVDWLTNHLGEQHKSLLYDAVFAFTEDEKQSADAKLRQYNLWPQIQHLLNTLQVLDPSCGSGSFLVGMLIVLDDLHQRIDNELGIRRRPYDRRRDIIGRNLYGVDVKDWAVHVAELRLWLQLVIETEINVHEAKMQPLLPNLSFKIRCGDSLVQEVGGINLAVRHSGYMPDSAIAGRINQLRGDKLNYYNNGPKAKTLQELQQAEFEIFSDLLSGRRTAIEQRLVSIAETPTQVALFDGGLDTKIPPERAKLERKREQLETELEQVKRAQDALKTVHDVPFVWDIAFVEVFESERRGFDIVIGNPPYVRHEEIRDPVNGLTNAEYKERLARAVYSAWPKTFGSQPGKKKKWTLDAKSDLYIYFYFHALSLLNEHGTFCFVTSNSWLDVGYGRDLQEFLLTRGLVKFVIDNQMRRSFATADVNTVIVLFGAAQDTSGRVQTNLDSVVRFVMVTTPFEVVLTGETWKTIETIEERTTAGEYRVFPATQNDLLTFGSDEQQHFEGDKWGGRYLRAPDIYWVILERSREKLVTIGDVADVRRGFTTGGNEFFYLDHKTALEWGIESEFLAPAVKSSRECDRIWLNFERGTKLYLFICNRNRQELRGTNALRYIEYGESQGYHQKPTVRTRARWWDLGVRSGARVNCNYLIDTVMRFFASDKPFFVSDNFQEIHSQVPSEQLALAFNSTVTQLFVNVVGRANFGDGLLKLQTYEVRNLLVPDPRLLNHEVSQVVRQVGLLGLEDAERRELDDVIFQLLGLTSGERDAVYEATDALVQNRLNKAGSLRVRQGV